MKNQPKQLATPFALSGDKQEIPNSGNFTDLSYASGYPPVYSQPLDQGGKEIERSGINGIFYDISDNIYSQQVGIPSGIWRQYTPGTEQTTKILQEYQKGALVWYNKIDLDDSTLTLIRSKVDNNTDIPTDTAISLGSSQWEYVFSDFSPVVLTRGSRITKGINETTMKGFLKLAGQAITDDQYAKIPAELAPTITTGKAGAWRVVDTRGFNQEILEQYQKGICFVTKYANGEMEISGWCNFLQPSVILGFSVQQDVEFPEPFFDVPIIKVTGYNYSNGELSEFNPDEYSKIISYSLENSATIYVGSGNTNTQLTTHFSVKGRWCNFYNKSVNMDYPNPGDIVGDVELKNPLDLQGFFYQSIGAGGQKVVKSWSIFKETPNEPGEEENRYFDLFYLAPRTTQQPAKEIYLGVLDVVDKIFSSPASPVLPAGTKITFVNVTDDGKNTSNFTTVDQILIEGSTTAVRIDNTKKSGFAFDNATLKLNENNDLFVNLNPLHGSYSNDTKHLELTPDWSIIKNKPVLAKKSELDQDIIDVKALIPSNEDISLQIKDLTYVQPIGLPMLVINSIPFLTIGKLYYNNTLAQMNGSIYFIKGDLIFNGVVDPENMEIANLKQSWDNILNKPELVTTEALDEAVAGLEEEIPAADNKTILRNFSHEFVVNIDNESLIYDASARNIGVSDLDKVVFVDDHTIYTKKRNGELVVKKQILIEKNAPKEIKREIVFPIPFFLGSKLAYSYSVRANKCFLVEMKTMLFSNSLYINMLRINSSVPNALNELKVSLIFERVLPVANSYWIEFEINGFWKEIK